MLTQGWGDSSDVAALAEQLLNQQGVVTMRIAVTPTEKGKQALAELIQAKKNIRIDSLPALLFTEANGQKKLVVFPWCKEIGELDGFVTWNGMEKEPQDWPRKIRISVKLEVDPNTSRQSAGNTRVAASALAGGGNVTKRKWITLFDETYLSENISLDALDIGYTETRKDGHPVLKVIVDGPNGGKSAGKISGSINTPSSTSGWARIWITVPGEFPGSRLTGIIPSPGGFMSFPSMRRIWMTKA